MESVKLVSNDGQLFVVDLKAANTFKTIKSMLENCNGGVPDDEAIRLPRVDGSTFKWVVQWAEHHKNDPVRTKKELESVPYKLSDWDKEFFKDMNYSTIFAIISAANYLDADELHMTGCKIVALEVRGKPEEDLRGLDRYEGRYEPTEEDWGEEKMEEYERESKCPQTSL